MKKWIALSAVALIAGGLIWLMTRKSAPGEVPFENARRETLVSQLSTNGKTEPVEWAEVTTAQGGRVEQILVKRGDAVGKGQALARLAAPGANAELAAAEARVAAARSEVETLKQGGRATELAELDASLHRLNIELESAQRDVQALERLLAQHAATRDERDAARDHLKRVQADVESLGNKRAALAPQADRTAAEARLRDAIAALDLVQKQNDEATVRAPRAGVVYDLPVHAGEWLEAGASVARVGELRRMKVTVYVDEPELGKVRLGLPVSVTWDALPGSEWRGTIGGMPAQVVPLGSRQVGEVVVLVDAPKRDLPPGANIDARLQSQVVENALTISKGSLRRENNAYGVYRLDGLRIQLAAGRGRRHQRNEGRDPLGAQRGRRRRTAHRPPAERESRSDAGFPVNRPAQRTVESREARLVAR